MRPKRRFFSVDTILVILALLCILLSVLLCIAKPVFIIPAAIALVLIVVLILLNIRRLRRALRSIISGKQEDALVHGVMSFTLPVAVLDQNRVIWCNQAFVDSIADGQEPVLALIEKLVPRFDYNKSGSHSGQDILHLDRRYTVYSGQLQDSLVFLTFVEDTQLKLNAEEYLASRPSVLYFVIDTYEDVLKEMRDSEKAKIVSAIDLELERYIGKSSGFLRRVSASRYLAVVEERHVQEMVENRFEILDSVRNIGGENLLLTLSVGVGRNFKTIKECDEMALSALDMALGRGGDQAAVKTEKGYEFFGGISRSVEKRSRVKSRLVAASIKELMQQSDRVLIMGHKNSDMDSVGAAVGMFRFSCICHKPAAIVIDEEKSLAGNLLQSLHNHGYSSDILSPEEALPLAGSRTLLVVVDTHIHYLLESKEIFDACPVVVVIDHHRKMVDHISTAAVFYHEPYASSTCELVAELLQFASDNKQEKPTPAEAEAMLAGIMLDTRTFSLHVGVRTFEAAAYLRRIGAQTAQVKKLFASSKDDYVLRSQLVEEATVYLGCAIAMSDTVPFDCEVIAPQAANDLLTIQNVQASFVGIQQQGEIRISARSMGEVNVQLIMEKLGGGGHLTMAGAQLREKSLEEAQEMLQNAIQQYREEHRHPSSTNGTE